MKLIHIHYFYCYYYYYYYYYYYIIIIIIIYIIFDVILKVTCQNDQGSFLVVVVTRMPYVVLSMPIPLT